MSTQSDSLADYGISGSLDWLVGGAVGGVVGSLLFGGVLWAVDPAIVSETIPAVYGLDPSVTTGAAFHLAHGLVLGVVFGFLVTREPILGALTADVETGFIAAIGPSARITLAGLVYGLAIWGLLPVLVLPAWGTVSGVGNPAFPVVVLESLVGHLLYGVLLGGVFSALVETRPEAEQTEAPFEEA